MRERELSHILGTRLGGVLEGLDNGNENQMRPGYRGQYIVDKVTQEIVRRNEISARRRRFLTDVPLFVVSAAIIIIITLLWDYFFERVADRKADGDIGFITEYSLL